MRTSLESMLGPLYEPITYPIEWGAARRMAAAINSADPIHYDRDAARQRGYRGIVGPWPLLWLVFNHAMVPMRFDFGTVTVHGSDEFEFHEPLIVGDDVTMTSEIVSAQPKRGRSGLLGYLLAEFRFTNQEDALCAVLRSSTFRR
jgi:acyl dehydratase